MALPRLIVSVVLVLTLFAAVAFCFLLPYKSRPARLEEIARVRSKRSTENTEPGVDAGRVVVRCNGITSTPQVLAAHESGRLREVCRCHWPTLYGQKNADSDCDEQHACDGGVGTLVHKITRRPLSEATPPVNIHEYVCSACDRCNVPGTDPDTGLPSCLPRPFNDRDRDMCIYGVESETDVCRSISDEGDESKTDYRTTKPMLAVRSPFVNDGYVSAFTDRVRDTAWLPNPCAFDLFTGTRLGDDCELRMTRKSRIAYCAPTRDNVVTAVKDDSYLSNNESRYPNACFRFASDEQRVNGYVIEYFLRKREGPRLPAPVVSMRIAKKDVLKSVVTGLGLTREPATKMLLFTQPEPPDDVDQFPHPFNTRRMADFTKEFNNWVDRLPAECRNMIGISYNCSAPAQSLAIPECSKVGTSDRGPRDKGSGPLRDWFGDQADVYAKSTVACTKPDYDTRFPIVPNYSVSVRSTDADPTSAILFFDKTDNTVRPHWKDLGANVSHELDEMKRYVREKLRSLPNEKL